MAFKYPNGKPFLLKSTNSTVKSEKKLTPKKSYSNRGMSFEHLINETNDYYLANNVAVIHKKPIPLQIVKVDYPRRSAAVIREAYFKQSSTTDYNGVYKGYYLDFEAKETKQASFPLKNVHFHQVEHIKNVSEHGGIAFLLIHLVRYDEIFFLTSDKFIYFWERMTSGGKKTISREDLINSGKIIKLGFNPLVNYLEEVENIISSISEK